MKTYTFRPNYEIVGNVGAVRPIFDLADEVGMYSATPAFVERHGGPISRDILERIPAAYYDETKAKGLMVNIDIRIHRLYPGDFPAYPGWHCDGEFRETFFSQPDIDRINVSRHLICTVSSHEGGVSNTEFLEEDLTVSIEKPTSDHTLWGQVHKALAVQSMQRPLRTRVMQDGEMVLFDPWSLHRATATRIRGWRMFFRASQWHRPNLGDEGKLSKQEQVYKIVEGGGW